MRGESEGDMEPERQPTVVKAEKRQQAGIDILVAPCPVCHQTRAVSGPGLVACLCGAHLKFEEAAK